LRNKTFSSICELTFQFQSSSVRPRRVDGYERKIKKAATVTVVTIDDEPEEDVVQTDLQEVIVLQLT
jgi:hypothetical protein